MGIYNKIRDKKLKYDINKEAANISALSPGIIDKYEYLTYLIFTLYIKLSCSFLGKALEKQRNKQLDDLKPLNLSNKRYELKTERSRICSKKSITI